MRSFYPKKKTAAQVAGSLAKANGRSAEEEVEEIAALYASDYRCEMSKRYEPYRRVSGGQGGSFRAIYLGKSGCDYELWLEDGRAGHVEVKSREADRVAKDVIDDTQKAQLNRRLAWGQLAIVLVRLRGVWFAVNFSKWHNGDRKSHNAEQLEELGVKLGATPDFLPHIERLTLLPRS